MNIENNEASANIGDPLATVSRRFSVAPMMYWTYSGRIPSFYWDEKI
ncbi:hypothetical protein ACTACN_12810 [Pseudomonas syringae]|nr:hypothetical protein [Pseudomonas syringae]